MGDVHWRELYHEVVDSGLCTGCAACVMACPRDVLGYTEDYWPVQVGEGHAFDQCTIGDRGCDICTRACPRFRNWESDLDEVLFGRPREADEVYGHARSILLTRATGQAVHEQGQDGGLVEEWMKGVIDAGLVEARPGEEDPVAMNLLTKLSTVSRKRWPGDTLPEGARNPGLLPIAT